MHELSRFDTERTQGLITDELRWYSASTRHVSCGTAWAQASRLYRHLWIILLTTVQCGTACAQASRFYRHLWRILLTNVLCGTPYIQASRFYRHLWRILLTTVLCGSPYIQSSRFYRHLWAIIRTSLPCFAVQSAVWVLAGSNESFVFASTGQNLKFFLASFLHQELQS